jgi:hypothetical protein
MAVPMAIFPCVDSLLTGKKTVNFSISILESLNSAQNLEIHRQEQGINSELAVNFVISRKSLVGRGFQAPSGPDSQRGRELELA